MRSFWSDPYLWVHLAGIAALPIFLEICFLGLAVGDPVLPMGLELLMVAVVGIAPIVWMQWQRPFYIFSLLAIALKPEQLSVTQRKLLQLFKSPNNRILGIAGSVVLLWVLWQLYRYAPIASEVTPLHNAGRGVGLLIAAIAFLASNLFLQVPLSVASVLLTREATFTATEPYPLEQIPKSFTSLGIPVKRILPDIVAEAPKPSPAATTVPFPSAVDSNTAPTTEETPSFTEATPPVISTTSPETSADDDFDELAADEIDGDAIASDDTDPEDIDTPEPPPPIDLEPLEPDVVDEVAAIAISAEVAPEPEIVLDDIPVENPPIDVTAADMAEENGMKEQE
ncbi:low-complexity tail membrane protein [Oscillatoria sp. FACHB-1407]|uniref:low-complexity tail membrane protein n=1 Tax=Oscillatoria sp. FACHB-1407 TaxID=2692847 RepID=UPI001688189F|nr:low-complexity tail membrane protein [Oscillatoria sp. FACHB-1407]MBD2465401.1 low-complexity tail membrane protein [Oscillatoria sp. FACHB-1407]